MSIVHAWNNRITRHADVPPGDLAQNPLNYKVHPPEQDEVLTALLAQVGWVDDVIVAEGSNVILDGHLRVAIALRQGEPTVPVGYVALTPEEETLVLATYDQVTRMASLNAVKVDTVLRQLDTDQPVLQDALDALARFAGLVWDEDAGDDVPWSTAAPDADGSEPDEDASEDDGMVQVRVGDYMLLVPCSAYEQWLADIRYEAGFSEGAINTEIVRRLERADTQPHYQE